MNYAWLGCLLFGSLLFAGAPDPDANVNSRYKVETVIVSGKGWSTDFATSQDKKVSRSLRKRIASLIGDQLNPTALDEVGRRLRTEFHASSISRHVLRGASPDYVRVVFEVGEKQERFDVSVPKFLYNSKQGWSGAIEGIETIQQNAFAFGLVSDNDLLPERYAGITARYENTHVGSEAVHFRFQFESYHDQWNRSTLDQLPPPGAALPVSALAGDTSGVYRTRQNFEPTVTFIVAQPLTVTVGTSFERFQEQFPEAHTQAANAVVTAVRYQGRLEDSDTEQEFEAGYSLRAATKVLDSDFVFARHRWGFRYALTHGRHMLSDDVTAGVISGRAPLYERYVLGNSSTLRGWNRFDLDPLGGNRMVHNSVDYRYGVFEIFYDAGAIWDAGLQPATPRHGIGVGFRQGAFALAVAFPVRSGRVDPIFMMGMNY